MDKRHTAAHRLLADGRPAYTPGKASDYIYHLPELLAENPDAPVVLHNRVSTAAQARAGNLDEAREHDLARLRALDAFIVEITDEVGNGSIMHPRPKLLESIEFALGYPGCIVVAGYRDRIIRGQHFDGTNVTEPPTDLEYQELMRIARGVRIATIAHPDKHGRSGQVMRGIKAKDADVGRPRRMPPGYKRRLRELKMPQAINLRNTGWSIRQVAVELGVPKSTVQDWFRKH